MKKINLNIITSNNIIVNITMLKITNDDNQLTDKVNEILNNDNVNNVKKYEWENKILENKLFTEDALQDKRVSNLIGALHSLIDYADYNKCFADLSKRRVENKYTFIINDNCGEDWVFDLIHTCCKFNDLKITYYSISDILKMPYDVAREKLGDINLSEYETDYQINNSLNYIEKLKHLTNCKFVLTYADGGKLPSFYYDKRVKYMNLDIPETGERTERLNEFKKVYGYMGNVLWYLLWEHVLFDRTNNNHKPSNEEIDSFWECV